MTTDDRYKISILMSIHGACPHKIYTIFFFFHFWKPREKEVEREGEVREEERAVAGRASLGEMRMEAVE